MASNVKTGDVLLEDFDRGVVETLGAVVNAEGSIYVIKNISGVDAPPGFEGVPVYFAFADDTLDPKILPSFVIRRDEIIPALSRWHLGLTEYKVPAVGSSEVTITNPITEETMATKVSNYFLTHEITGTYDGMMVSLPPEHWVRFQTMGPAKLAAQLNRWARNADLDNYPKQPRGPKKPKPKRPNAQFKHVSTAKLLEAQRQKKKKQQRTALTAGP